MTETLQGTKARRAQLETWMDERRQQLRLRWARVAELAGMTTPNLLRIRKGKIRISWEAAAGIEDALLWERGSVEAAVLHGIPPVVRAGVDAASADVRVAESTASRGTDGHGEWTEVDERKVRLLEQVFESWGEEMTAEKVAAVLDELRSRVLADSPEGTGTQGDQSGRDSDVSLDRRTRR